MEYTALREVLIDNSTYIIPPYQRPYSWDCIGKSEKNNQINVMWDDIYNFFIQQHKSFYFMGSMVLIPNNENERIFEVIDGQQRLTSLTLLFAAVKCFFNQLKNNKFESEFDIKLIHNEAIRSIESVIYNVEFINIVKNVKKLKIAKDSDFDYDLVLENVLECNQLPNLKDLEIKYNLYEKDEQKKIVLRYYNNIKYFEDKIEECFLTKENKFTVEKFRELDSFIVFLKTKISFIIIKAKDFEFAYRIFETLNNRGLPLSNKDLFRNFVIEKFTELIVDKPHISPSKMWNVLEKNYNFREDFISRWVESKKEGQQKFSAFNDLKDEIYANHYQNTIDKTKIELLYEDLKEDLTYYTLIINPDLIENLEIRNRILFLHQCRNNRYTINLLLSLFRSVKYLGNENNLINYFLIVYEKFILYTLLNPLKRFSNTLIYKSIKYLNLNDFENAKNIFKLANENELKDFLDTEIKDNELAKLLIFKYILYLQTVASNDVIYQKLYFDKATLEHIIPQTPDLQTNWLTDFSDKFKNEFTYKLGNMTLLNRIMNAAAKNFDFSIKKEKYLHTNLSFTKEITILEKITEDFIRERQNLIVNTLLKDMKIN